ncbi:hypothetical protein SAMN05216374_5918 [Tardiphaga sp. OK246]|uniref:hypothetical protein n=1 Tax=Tardiphaga sp. OK246 TaxID=1855307 RepID=UPI000B663D25|nr:hypothetical protein [Tardiphaga sp. OK246]SNT61541.1 hypothetical protein SAMN05216374_5918 [Tardiphaga sp. OK246]
MEEEALLLKIAIPAFSFSVDRGEKWELSAYARGKRGDTKLKSRNAFAIHKSDGLEPLLMQESIRVARLTGGEATALRKAIGVEFGRSQRDSLDRCISQFVHTVVFKDRLPTWKQIRTRVVKILKHMKELEDLLSFGAGDEFLRSPVVSLDATVHHFFSTRSKTEYLEKIASAFEAELPRLQQLASKRGTKRYADLDVFLELLWQWAEAVEIEVTLPSGSTKEKGTPYRATRFGAFAFKAVEVACRKGRLALSSGKITESERLLAEERFTMFGCSSEHAIDERLRDVKLMRSNRLAGSKAEEC